VVAGSDLTDLSITAADSDTLMLLLATVVRNLPFRSLMNEILRVLLPGGLFVYTVWSTADVRYGKWLGLGNGLFERDRFAVRFLDLGLVPEFASVGTWAPWTTTRRDRSPAGCGASRRPSRCDLHFA
jgi:SAM-dependent methyltransferase